jgi:DNA-binding MarR family transcriptional regulator
MNHKENDHVSETLITLDKLIALSLDLHHLNAGIQKKCEISMVQWLILKKIIQNPGISAGGLADISGIHPSTLTPTIRRLEATKLIHLIDLPTDLRRKFIISSWQGFEIYKKAEKTLLHALEGTKCQKMGPIDCDNVRGLIKILLDSI